MGFWTGIKRALNSTVGTRYFKPLDKLISEKIDGVRTLGASDATIIVVGSGHASTNSTTHLLRFKANVSGSMRLMGTATVTESNYGDSGGIGVSPGGFQGGNGNGTTEGNHLDVCFDFPITAGETYSVYVKAGRNQNTDAYNIRLGASVIDASMVSVL